MTTLTSNKFEIGDYVYLGDDLYFISGRNLKCGYDIFAWEYYVARPLSGQLDPSKDAKLYFKVNYEKQTVREGQLKTVEEYRRKKRDQLLKKREEVLAELEAVEREIGGQESEAE